MNFKSYKPNANFTTDQNVAIESFLTQFQTHRTTGDRAWCFSLSGYAGTGKTHLVGEIIRQLHHHGAHLRIAVAAPTNKSVQVLCAKLESTVPRRILDHMSVRFGTIHSFLRLQPEKKPGGEIEFVRKDQKRPPIRSYDLVIIDECSMIGKRLHQMIQQNVRSGAGILYVGDPAQLPPVQESAHSETFDSVHRAHLNQIVRQAEHNSIIQLTMHIREHYTNGTRITYTQLKPFESDTVRFESADTVIENRITDVESDTDSRILCYTNRQVESYNRIIHERLYPDEIEPFAIGERIIVHEPYKLTDQTDTEFMNSSAEMLITSEECTVLDITSTELTVHNITVPVHEVILERDTPDHQTVTVTIPDDWNQIDGLIRKHFDAWRTYKAQARVAHGAERNRLHGLAAQNSRTAWDLKERFARLRHAYAMTVHKSQGSTFTKTYVDWTDINRIRDDTEFNQCFYVAATRPAQELIIIQ